MSACGDDNDGPQSTQCLGTLTASSTLVAVGGTTSLQLAFANPDDDTGAALGAAWTASGGGHFDPAMTTLNLTPFIDPYGFPAGTSGTTTNDFHADGPPGTYRVHVSLPAGGGCGATTFDATLQVVASLPDAGTAPDAAAMIDAADAGAIDASDTGVPLSDASGETGATDATPE